MMYLLDANVLIDANRDYYPVDSVPEFWNWLSFHGSNGTIKIPIEIFEEVKRGDDGLSKWAKNEEVERALLLDEEVDIGCVRSVINVGYAQDITDDELEKLGRDPFLVAYALCDSINRCVVTTEVSKPRKTRANRHLPDVCSALDVRWCHTFELTRVLEFRTDWQDHT